jgi:hypothetical protein
MKLKRASTDEEWKKMAEDAAKALGEQLEWK